MYTATQKNTDKKKQGTENNRQLFIVLKWVYMNNAILITWGGGEIAVVPWDIKRIQLVSLLVSVHLNCLSIHPSVCWSVL